MYAIIVVLVFDDGKFNIGFIPISQLICNAIFQITYTVKRNNLRENVMRKDAREQGI